MEYKVLKDFDQVVGDNTISYKENDVITVEEWAIETITERLNDESISPIIGETIPHVVSQEELDNAPELAKNGIKEGDIIETPVEQVTAASTDLTYKGKKVTNVGTREVNGTSYHTITTEDGSTHDLTEEEYQNEVK